MFYGKFEKQLLFYEEKFLPAFNRKNSPMLASRIVNFKEFLYLKKFTKKQEKMHQILGKFFYFYDFFLFQILNY